MKDGKYMSFRISHVKTSLKEVFDIFSSISEQVIVCEETATKAGKHYHGIMLLKEGQLIGKENKLFRKEMKLKWPLLETPRSFSCSLVEKEQYFSYILKDGCYLYKGISDELIEQYASKSYKKYDKTVFAQEWDEIRMDKKLAPRVKVERFIQLKRKYNQNIKMSDLEMLYLTFMCDTDSTFISHLVSAVAINVHTRLDPNGLHNYEKYSYQKN